MIGGAPLTSKQRKNYTKHTTSNGTLMNTLLHLANVSTTTKKHSSDRTSPSPTRTSYNSISRKSTTVTNSANKTC